MPINIYLIEDHPILQYVIREVIDKLPNLSTCGVVASGREALLQIPALQPDLVITDVNLADMSGIDLIGELHRLLPHLPTMILSSHQDRYYVKQALAAGARGYVVKGYPAEVERGIQHILAGEIYLCPRCRFRFTLSPQTDFAETLSVALGDD